MTSSKRFQPPPCDSECGEMVRNYFKERGTEAHVTHIPPLIDSVYEPLNMTCPHGVEWYAEPTSEQRAQWIKDGVA